MDPQEINHKKPVLTIPEQEHNGVQDTGPYVPTPQISEMLADAGLHDHKDGETYLKHLEEIEEAMKKYGTIQGVNDPSEASVQQVQNPPEHIPHDIPSTRTEDLSGQMSSPQRSLIQTMSSNAAKPFEIISTGIRSVLKRMFIRGSSASSAFNGRSTVADVIELQGMGNELPIPPIPENVSSIEEYKSQRKTPEETPEQPIPSNVVSLRRDVEAEEIRNAA